MNLPNVNIKDILQKLGAVKNNMSLLVSIIITVVAALLFAPAYFLNNNLRQKIEKESIANGARKIQNLNNKVVSKKLADAKVEQLNAQAKDVNNIINLVRQSTERELLSYDIFPEPDPNGFSQLVFQQFGQKFREGIDGMISRYKGRDCPTITELQRRLQESTVGLRSGMGGMDGRYPGGSSIDMGATMGPYGGGGREAIGYPSARGGRGGMPGMGIESRLGMLGTGDNELQKTIIDEVCRSRAKDTLIYINPSNLSGYNFWADYKYDVVKEDAIQDCWYYQLGYWIIEDIFTTINNMNSAYENVLTAPVKRFMQISFTINMMNPGMVYGGRGMGSLSQANVDRPKYATSPHDGLTESCTGRYSNAEEGIDVVHFDIKMVVSAKSVLPFIDELCSAKEHKFYGYPDANSPPKTFKHNQITVLESKIRSIGPDDYMHTFYRYGDEPVVELDLVCEYLFNREGYDIIKPESVIETLNGEG